MKSEVIAYLYHVHETSAEKQAREEAKKLSTDTWLCELCKRCWTEEGERTKYEAGYPHVIFMCEECEAEEDMLSGYKGIEVR